MNEYEIIPNVGVGPIKLGMTREEVEMNFGQPEDKQENRHWFNDGFAIDFNDNGKVEFIELAKSQRFKGIFKGKCLHDLPAEEAVSVVYQYDSYNENDPDLGYSYVFLKLQLSLWRGTITESNEDGGGRFFEAVSIAEDGYFTEDN